MITGFGLSLSILTTSGTDGKTKAYGSSSKVMHIF